MKRLGLALVAWIAMLVASQLGADIRFEERFEQIRKMASPRELYTFSRECPKAAFSICTVSMRFLPSFGGR